MYSVKSYHGNTDVENKVTPVAPYLPPLSCVCHSLGSSGNVNTSLTSCRHLSHHTNTQVHRPRYCVAVVCVLAKTYHSASSS